MRRALFSTAGLVLLLSACSSHDGQDAASPAAKAVAHAELDKAETGEGTEVKSEALAKTDPVAEKKDDRPRIGALGPHTWIWKKPDRKGLAIGKMRIGTAAVLKSKDPIDGPGCRGKWYSIEPRGFVCDDDTATLNLDDPWYKVLEYSAPQAGVWPYRYAHSNGTPMYSRVPTEKEWTDQEREYGPVNTWKPLGKWAEGHEENIVDEPIKATDEVPYFLKDGKRTAPAGNYNINVLVLKRMPAGSMLAYSKAFESRGRVWLLTPDGMVVPADRVSHMKTSTFKGVDLENGEERLPFAWNRAKKPIAKYQRNDDGSFSATSETIASKAHVEIGDAQIEKDGMIFYELRKEPGRWVGKNADGAKALDVDLVVTRPVTALPKTIGPNQKWIEAKIAAGTLTAYVGLKPVRSTLFSPGKGGPPLKEYKFPEDHSKYATTATGRFPLEWKERVATMSNEKGEPKVLWFTDVPNQQYLKAPLAMHVAYWHEDFGKRKSAECLNVSPIDGQWLFSWTLPQLPEGWNAVGAGGGNGESTPVIVSVN